MVRGWWLSMVLCAGCDRIWGLHPVSGSYYEADATPDVAIDAPPQPCNFQPLNAVQMGAATGEIALTIDRGGLYAIAIRSDHVVEQITPPLGTPQSISDTWAQRMWTSVAFTYSDLYVFDGTSAEVYIALSTSMTWMSPQHQFSTSNLAGVGGMDNDFTMVTPMADSTFHEFRPDLTWQDLGTYTAADFGVTGTIYDPSMTLDGLSLVFVAQLAGGAHGIFGATRPSTSARFGTATQLANADARTPYPSTCSRIYAVDRVSGRVELLTP